MIEAYMAICLIWTLLVTSGGYVPHGVNCHFLGPTSLAHFCHYCVLCDLVLGMRR